MMTRRTFIKGLLCAAGGAAVASVEATPTPTPAPLYMFGVDPGFPSGDRTVLVQCHRPRQGQASVYLNGVRIDYVERLDLA